ncbi:hypothetical protein GLAREA_02937 [Glarea lozoyensis ATCC 20868]|uniref:Uncharacterized protein n=1 Tax=Glarea lozoyensis (strain ATCC 20868 / MF5171) TaxID=1116229 RepID=S3DKE0_GLAL2|nr:uncharacterized protein GLAREA_02937 [Glarea lozoyensis ATCC 20868]EPE27023.1 hypothetical protein GLAREA_02937 [Glarea lozoyensis ATCC 20868]
MASSYTMSLMEMARERFEFSYPKSFIFQNKDAHKEGDHDIHVDVVELNSASKYHFDMLSIYANESVIFNYNAGTNPPLDFDPELDFDSELDFDPQLDSDAVDADSTDSDSQVDFDPQMGFDSRVPSGTEVDSDSQVNSNQQLNINSDPSEVTSIFHMYNKLPRDLEHLLNKTIISAHKPQRVVLSGSSMKPVSNIYRRSHATGKCPAHPPGDPNCPGASLSKVPALLLANKSAYADFKSCGYIKLKLNEDSKYSPIFNVCNDLFYLHRRCSSEWSAASLFEAFSRAKAVDKVRSLALSVNHFDFPQVLLSLPQYPNLELVLIVLDDDPYTTESHEARRKNLTKARKRARKHFQRPWKTKFQVLHPNNVMTDKYPVLKAYNLPQSVDVLGRFRSAPPNPLPIEMSDFRGLIKLNDYSIAYYTEMKTYEGLVETMKRKVNGRRVNDNVSHCS